MKKITIGAGIAIIIIVVIVAYGFSVDEKIQNNSSDTTTEEIIETTETEGKKYTLSLSDTLEAADKP